MGLKLYTEREMFLKKILDSRREEGLLCPHCGKWNTHDECGTYQTMFPECIHCELCTEVFPEDLDLILTKWALENE